MKQNDLNEKKYKYKKATRRPLFYEERRIYLSFWGLSCWESGAFFLYSFVELGGYENHSVVLDTLDIQPFLWLEAAFNGDHCSLSEAVEWRGGLVLAPCLDVHEGWGAVVLFAVLLCAVDCQWEAYLLALVNWRNSASLPTKPVTAKVFSIFFIILNS